MRDQRRLLVILGLLFSFTQAAFTQPPSSHHVEPGNAVPLVFSSQTQFEVAPKVTHARLKGRKLFVEGETFGVGAVIFVNGEKQKTRHDEDSPATILIAPKAGRRIPLDQIVRIQVRNGDESISDQFLFFTGLTISLSQFSAPIELNVGDRFMLFFNLNPNANPLVLVRISLDSKAFQQIDLGEAVPGSEGVFQAMLAGRYLLRVERGDLCPPPSPIPCPPLPGPVVFNGILIVE